MSTAQSAFLEFILSMKRIACPRNSREAFGFDRLAGDFTGAVSATLDAANGCEHLKNRILGRAGRDQRKTRLRFVRGRFSQIVEFGSRSFATRAVSSHQPISLFTEPLVMFAPARGNLGLPRHA